MGRVFSFLLAVVMVGGGAVLIARNLPQASQSVSPAIVLEPVDEAPRAATTTVSASTSPMPEARPMKYTVAQVGEHKDANSCWSTIDGGVYDLTEWITKHPGGQAAILKICGKDGTTVFRNKHGTAERQQNALDSMKIGDLAS